MSESIPPLDPSVLGPLRETERAPAAVRARARERLLRAVGGGGPGGDGGRGQDGGSGGRGGSGIPRMPHGIAFVLGGVVGVGLYAALAPAPAPRIVYVDRPAPTIQAATVATAALTQTPEVSAAASNPSPTAITTARASIAGDPRVGSTRGSQLSAERILLDEARAAIAQGDPGRAIERLERHRRTFSQPLLGEERDAMWVQALVKAGRYDEARARASTFRRRSPDSLFSSVVDSAIDSIP